ncbi:MAG: stage II sporulation protein M [Thermoproteota archaeon]
MDVQYFPPPYELPSPPYPLNISRASVSELFNVSYWLWRLNPSSVLPVILSSVFEVLRQSIMFIVLLFELSELADTGLFRALSEALKELDIQPLIPVLQQAAARLIPIIAVSVSLFFMVTLLAGGFLNSAEYGSYLRVMRTGGLSIQGVLEEIRVRWVSMVWTVLVVELVKNWPIIIATIWILADIPSLPSLSIWDIWSRLLLWLAVFLAALIAMAVFSFLTVYSYPAAVSGSYGFAAVKESIKVCLRIPGDTVVYALLRVVVNFLIILVVYFALLINIEISSAATILLSLIVTPVFRIFKTGLFLKASPGPVFAPLPIGPPLAGDLFLSLWRDGLSRVKKGFRWLMAFLLELRNIVFHVSSILVFSAGLALGRHILSTGLGEVLEALWAPGEVNPLFNFPPGLPFLAIDISFHNWQVSLSTALSGIVFMFPTITSLVFNGFILGVVQGITKDIVIFLAAILPHGIIELPSFITAGSAGLRLGFSFLKALKNRTVCSDPGFVGAVRQTVYIVLGLLPLFIVAGIVEAFITPQIMHLYGWR